MSDSRSDRRSVIYRDVNHTEMTVTNKGSAKAFAAQLIREGKAFRCSPEADDTWNFVIYEFNHPNRWEGGQ